MSKVAIKPELIRWAIARSGLPEESLRKKYPKLEGWKSGEDHPTFKQLETFAKATMTPFGSLFLNSPPVEELPIADFRTVNDAITENPSPNLLDILYTVQRQQAWMREFRIDDGSSELSFVGSVSGNRNYKTVAQHIRQELDLPVDWAEQLPTWEAALNSLRTAIEHCGILVFSNSVVGLNNHRPLDPEEFRGFVLCDRYAPVIFVNSADSKSAQMFTLAHELAHIWCGQDGLFNLINMLPFKNDIEKFCNQVAAEFLIPEYKLKQQWPEVKSKNKPFHLIAKHFKVSPVVVARRALDLKLITKPGFFHFYETDRREWRKLKSEQKKKKSGGDFYATLNSRLSHQFSNAVVRATLEGRLLYRQAYQLTGIKGSIFKKYSSRVLKRMKNEQQ